MVLTGDRIVTPMLPPNHGRFPGPRQDLFARMRKERNAVRDVPRERRIVVRL